MPLSSTQPHTATKALRLNESRTSSLWASPPALAELAGGSLRVATCCPLTRPSCSKALLSGASLCDPDHPPLLPSPSTQGHHCLTFKSFPQRRACKCFEGFSLDSLGFDISERPVARWVEDLGNTEASLLRAPADPSTPSLVVLLEWGTGGG